MPTYQYACTQCGHRLEAVQSFADAPLTICTECQGKLRKVYSSVGVVFKGSGFYRTDSRASATDSPNGTSGEKAPEKTSAGAGTSSNGASGPNGSSSSAASSSASSSGSKPAVTPA